MGERKVLNFYIPPDMDASIIPKSKRKRDKQIDMRMMLPFSIRCNTCGEFMYAGKKFNSKMELIQGEAYMGIKRFRFYIKCSVCSAEITFKTDPKNSDYEMEFGASRNFESWREREKQVVESVKEREEEDAMDSMKALENRTLDNKIEMDILDTLDEIKAINQRHERVDTNKLLDALNRGKSYNQEPKSDFTAEDEKLIQSIKFKQSGSKDSNQLNYFEIINERLIEQKKQANVEDLQSVKKKTNSLFPSTNVIPKKKSKLLDKDSKLNTAVPSDETIQNEKTDSKVAAVKPVVIGSSSSNLMDMLNSYEDYDD